MNPDAKYWVALSTHQRIGGRTLGKLFKRFKKLENVWHTQRSSLVEAGLDLGQSIVVKDRVVLAVESIEGTDEAIRRAERYGKGGIVVIKVTKPRQDMRFDVPVVGPDTIKLLQEVKAACLAIEAKKTLIIDKEETLKLADEAGVVIAAL